MGTSETKDAVVIQTNRLSYPNPAFKALELHVETIVDRKSSLEHDFTVWAGCDIMPLGASIAEQDSLFFTGTRTE